MKALAAPACRLRVLNVEYNNFTTADIALFADGLAANRTLRHLSLEGNIVTGIGVEVRLELTLRLQLTVLVLGDNYISRCFTRHVVVTVSKCLPPAA